MLVARGLRVPRPDFFSGAIFRLPCYCAVDDTAGDRREAARLPEWRNFNGIPHHGNDQPFAIPSRGTRRSLQGDLAFAQGDHDHDGACSFHGPARQSFFCRGGLGSPSRRHPSTEFGSLAHDLQNVADFLDEIMSIS